MMVTTMKTGLILMMFAALLAPFWSASGQTSPKNPPAQDQAKKESGKGQEAKIEIQSAPVREKALPYSPVLGELKEGDTVRVLSASGAWIKIKTKEGLEGWIHNSSVARYQKAKFTIGAAPSETEPENAEAYAAAKGFNEEVEKEYKKEKNLEATFQQVDWIEKNPGAKKNAKELDAKLREFRRDSKIGEFYEHHN